MYNFGHISLKQRQLPDQQVDSGLNKGDFKRVDLHFVKSD